MTLLALLVFAVTARTRRLSSLLSPSLPVAATLSLAVALPLLLTGVAQADVFVDRDYEFGDQAAENGVAGNTLGAASSNNATWDSAGSASIEFQDLLVRGNPTYVAVGVGAANERPGAGSGSLGGSFNGVDDYVLTPINLAVPSDVWNNETYFPALDFPHNFENINVQGMQMWVKPNGSTQGVRQDIIKNSGEHGISITENNTWGLVADTPTPKDSGVPVAYDQWSHVMQVSGINNLSLGSSMSGGALFVNGVIVKAHIGTYEFHENQPLTIGAMQFDGDLGGATPSAPENFYHGLIDDVEVFIWGTNALNFDYGTFNAGTDNEWIATQLAGFDVADINFDGTVSGDGTGSAANDDVTMLIENWLTQQDIDGVQLGDWNSRQGGDLNFDGIIDLKDAFLLREGLMDSGLGTLDFSLLQAVPEPTAITLVTFALLVGGTLRRRNENRIPG